ncbi:MAG: hypothetical protein JWM93_272 [Frankiales bacterium]|nr:hypothetical protein [Frankiales bacterium]
MVPLAGIASYEPGGMPLRILGAAAPKRTNAP